MARILYVTQWFDPEPNIVKGPAFVRALEKAGHEVEVLTGFPNYPTGRIYPGYRQRPLSRETVDGASVIRVPLFPSHDTSSVGRSLNFISFFVSVFSFLMLRGRQYDLWYVYHPPITPGVAAALVGRVLRRPFVLEIQDLWPDTVTASGMAGTGRMGRLIGALCAFVYRRAARIIVQSKGIAYQLVDRGVPAAKVRVVYNWADASALALPAPDRGALGIGQEFAVVYGGNLGRMQALGIALEAAAILKAKGLSILLVLVGDGIDRDALVKEAVRRNLSNVRFVARVSQGEIGHWFAAADSLLLNIADDPLFAITIPSKTQYYLACGRPIIACIEGEAGAILKNSGAAIVVAPEDPVALARAIEEMAAKSLEERAEMGAAGQAYYDAELAFQRGIDKTLALIAEPL